MSPPASTPLPASVDPSAGYLLARLRIVESRVRALVAQRRREDPGPEDPFLGLYLSDEHVDAPAEQLAHCGDRVG